MEAYTGFAQVYDKFMDNIEYDKWCEYLVSILKEYGAPSEDLQTLSAYPSEAAPLKRRICRHRSPCTSGKSSLLSLCCVLSL